MFANGILHYEAEQASVQQSLLIKHISFAVTAST